MCAQRRLRSAWAGRSGPEVIKLCSCSTQLSMKFSLLINMKMPIKVCIFIFISREILCSAMVSKKEIAMFINLLFIYQQDKFHAQLSWAWQKFYNLGARFFAVRMKALWITGYRQNVLWRIRSHCTNAQVDVNRCWAHTQSCRKCCTRLIFVGATSKVINNCMLLICIYCNIFTFKNVYPILRKCKTEISDYLSRYFERWNQLSM